MYCFDDFPVNLRMVFNSSLALVCTAQFSPPPWATYLPCCLKLPALPIIKASTGANNTNKWWKGLKEIIKSLLKRKSLQKHKTKMKILTSFRSLFGNSKVRVISSSTVFLTVFLFYILAIQSGKSNKILYSKYLCLLTYVCWNSFQLPI